MNGYRVILVVLAAAVIVPSSAIAAEASDAARSRYDRAMQELGAGRVAESVQQLQKLALESTGADLDLAETGLGAAYRISGKIREARAKLKGPIDRSAYVPALVELARTYLYAPPFQPKEALAILKRAIAREPRNFEVLLELAHVHVNSGNLEAAEKVFQSLTGDIAPSDLRGWLGLADVYVQKRRFDKAKPVLRTAMEMAPGDPEPYYGMGNMVMSDESEHQHMAKAVGWFERAVELGKGIRKYYAALIYAYYRNGNNLAAAPILERLESFAADSSEAFWARGVFSEYRGQMGRALESYKTAVSLDTGNVYAQYSLGVFLSGRRNTDFIMIGADRDWKYLPHRNIDAALDGLRTALAINPAMPFAARAERLIGELESTSLEEPYETPELREMRRQLADYHRVRIRMY